MGASRSVRSYARLDMKRRFVSEVGVEQIRRAYVPRPVVSENRIRLADPPKLSLSCWIIVHVRMILFTELRERFVNWNPRGRPLG
jgi:hypothetical protein